VGYILITGIVLNLALWITGIVLNLALWGTHLTSSSSAPSCPPCSPCPECDSYMPEASRRDADRGGEFVIFLHDGGYSPPPDLRIALSGNRFLCSKDEPWNCCEPYVSRPGETKEHALWAARTLDIVEGIPPKKACAHAPHTFEELVQFRKDYPEPEGRGAP
jgi:hypothetical protein